MSARLLVGLTLLLASCAPSPGESGSAEAAIVDGEPTSQLGAVVAIAPRRVRCGELSTVLCSGTLIAPDAVLSAAHCFDSMRPGLAYEVFAGAAVGPDARAVAVLEVTADPSFDSESRQDDVAILWLAGPLEGVQPEPLPAANSPDPELDDRVTLAGFGATSAGAAPDGLKRVGSGRIEDIRSGVVAVSPDPSVSCVGDSGGPLFSETGELIGVASSGDTGCAETSVYALVAPAVEDFIEPVLAMGPLERPAEVDACQGSCFIDADCPAGFVCIPDALSSEFRCALPGREPGSLGRSCDEELECGAGFCAQSPIESSCQCYEPCAASPESTSSGGCSIRYGDCDGGALWLLGFLLWFRARS